jgi:glucose-6-phosphate-specific signal transduction histidine kinase
MKKSTTLAMALAFVSICVLLAAGILALSFTEELRMFSLLVVPIAIAGSLLALYFDWRGKLLRRVLGEPQEGQELDTAA